MVVSTENIHRWIEQSDIDYYTLFVKAWIPFNAWYSRSYSNLDSDRAKINMIKKDPHGLMRKSINRFLESDEESGLEFKSHLGGLHRSLGLAQLQYENEKMILFEEIIREKNLVSKIDNQEVRGIKYYLERIDSRQQGEITSIKIYLKNRNGVTTFSYTHDEYSLKHLRERQEFLNLSDTQKDELSQFFEKIKPEIITSALENNPIKTPQNYYQCDKYTFIRDNSDTNCRGHLIVKALIETLYQLRNTLFHGCLNPTAETKPVYMYAYHILKMLLDCIKSN